MDTWLLLVAVLSFAARDSVEFLGASPMNPVPTTQYALAGGLFFSAISDDAALPHLSRVPEAVWLVARLCFAPVALVVVPHLVRVSQSRELFWISNLLGLLFAGICALVTTYLLTRRGADLVTGVACTGIAVGGCIDIATTHRAVQAFAKGVEAAHRTK